MTEWRAVIGHPHYEVSDEGQVRSLQRVITNRIGVRKRRRGLVLKATPTKVRDGRFYRRVSIDGRNIPVAGLVLEAFVGPRPPGQLTRHLNDNSMDDRLVNLAWGTRKENGQDCARNGRSIKRLPNEVTEDIRAAYEGGESQRSIAERYGVSQNSISQRLKRIVYPAALVCALAAAVQMSTPEPLAHADSGLGCLTEKWGFLGSSRRTLCDTPRAADGSWTRLRVVWTPAHYVPFTCSGGLYYSSCSGGYAVDETLQAKETYPVTDSSVLPDEPGWLPTGSDVIR